MPVQQDFSWWAKITILTNNLSRNVSNEPEMRTLLSVHNKHYNVQS